MKKGSRCPEFFAKSLDLGERCQWAGNSVFNQNSELYYQTISTASLYRNIYIQTLNAQSCYWYHYLSLNEGVVHIYTGKHYLYQQIDAANWLSIVILRFYLYPFQRLMPKSWTFQPWTSRNDKGMAANTDTISSLCVIVCDV